eukprot:TRINITY_DN7806_c0_g1_i10.p1 TRINITY_DN7806_c0_g1~~TRINITY_DN7806_c0_g1_i10.p1  ORF type:complete len:299 (+),score=64.14 TRINITY_DN7806_c0_g1_i10:864-1760(+)
MTTSIIPQQLDEPKLLEWVVDVKVRELKRVKQELNLYLLRSDFTDGEGNPELKSRAESVLAANNIEGSVLHVGAFGSNSIKGGKNTQWETISDHVAVYVSTKMSVVYDSLHPLPIFFERTQESGTRYQRGLQVLEISNFFQLLLKGSHVMLESLLCDEETEHWTSKVWLEKINLEQSPNLFIYTCHVMHYLGNADSLLKRTYASDTERTKYHTMAYKFLRQAGNIMDTGVPKKSFPPDQLSIFLRKTPTPPISEMSREIKELRGRITSRTKSQKDEETKRFSCAQEYINSFILGTYDA